MRRNTIIIADDMEVNRLILEDIFADTYETKSVSNGIDALAALREYSGRVAAVLLDIEMPVMNGFQFLEKASMMPEVEGIPIIVISVDDTSESQIRAFDYGVADIIRKPFNARVLYKRVKNAISLFEYRERLESTVELQTYQLEEKEKELAKVNSGMLDALSSIVEFRDLETGEHVQRIKNYTQIMCDKLYEMDKNCGLSKRDIDYIVSASAMHDIGKIAIPDAILLKPGKLTPEEFDVIKTHTVKGAEILDKVDILNSEEYLKICKNICLYHHEKYDGKGYPKGLIAEEIPIEAQIVSIADVFDALVSKRCYKAAYSIESSRDMILNGECGQFSDRIIECFKQCFEQFKSIATTTVSQSEMAG